MIYFRINQTLVKFRLYLEVYLLRHLEIMIKFNVHQALFLPVYGSLTFSYFHQKIHCPIECLRPSLLADAHVPPNPLE